MSFVAITAVGRDRPGIVSGLTGVLYELGCNLEETTMTGLRGEFAMLMLVRLPASLALPELESALHETGRRMGLTLEVRPLAPDEETPRESGGAGYMLRVYGADRPGIVHAATRILAEHNLNITDLNTRVLPGSNGPVYVLLLEVDAPSPDAAEAVRPELERLRAELNVDLSFSELEDEAL